MPNSPLFSKFHPGQLILPKGTHTVFHFATFVSIPQNNYFWTFSSSKSSVLDTFTAHRDLRRLMEMCTMLWQRLQKKQITLICYFKYITLSNDLSDDILSSYLWLLLKAWKPAWLLKPEISIAEESVICCESFQPSIDGKRLKCSGDESSLVL